MFDRDKTDVDQDIEFEFFDDPPTTEASRVDEHTMVSPGPGRRRPGGSRRGEPDDDEGPRRRIPGAPTIRTRRPTAGQNWLRLGLLAAAVVVLVVALVFGVRSCGGSASDSYRDYFEKVEPIAGDSAQLGRETVDTLTGQAQAADVQAALQGLSQQQQQLANRALGLKPPSSLAVAHENLVEAMQFRASGLEGMAQVFGNIADQDESGVALAQQASRLVASDAIYADLFQGVSQQTLEAENVSGIAIPESTFVTNLDLFSPRTSKELIERVSSGGGGDSGSGQGLGLRGNGVTKVVAQPGSLELSRDTDTEVQGTEDLSFDVYVENSGDFQEAGVVVQLTLQQPGRTIRKSGTIDIINPGEEKIVKISGFDSPKFAVPSKLRVRVDPVDGETNKANNTAEFPVILTLS